MGVSVYGRKPNDKYGECFDASWFTWRPIHELICQLCEDLIDDETLNMLGFNSGAGPKSQYICNEMAKRFEMLLEQGIEGFSLGIDVYIDKNGSVGVAKSGTRDQERLGGYEVSRERLEDWITFLRSCGGFEVC